MIIVLKPNSTPEQIDHIVATIHEMGLKTDVSQGIKRTIIGVIGEEDLLRNAPLQAIPGVEEVVPILKPYKMASREYQQEDSAIDVGRGVKVGGGHLAMIAGPCAIEGRDILLEIATHVKKAGANILRGGAYKPRTSPYSFQGLGEDGLKILRDVGDELEMPVVTEVMDPRQVSLVDKYTDIFQIGARNMQNFNLLKELAKSRTPVLLKRGISATIEELLLSSEYLLSGGNYNVILCERGIRTFESYTRNTMDISAIPVVKKLSHLPMMADPSHGTGRRDKVIPMARAAVAAGADGLLVEVHPTPDQALSDGAQSLYPDQFTELMQQLRMIAPAVGRTL